jgi:hypothetical protein
VAALAVTSGIGALNGWTLVTTEVSRAAAQDGLFPRAFAWTDRKDTAWFGVVMAALLPSLLLWSYTTKTGLTIFTDLVDLAVVTVAIPYLFSGCSQGKPRTRHGSWVGRIPVGQVGQPETGVRLQTVTNRRSRRVRYPPNLYVRGCLVLGERCRADQGVLPNRRIGARVPQTAGSGCRGPG